MNPVVMFDDVTEGWKACFMISGTSHMVRFSLGNF